jgi:hypothetical protein
MGFAATFVLQNKATGFILCRVARRSQRVSAPFGNHRATFHRLVRVLGARVSLVLDAREYRCDLARTKMCDGRREQKISRRFFESLLASPMFDHLDRMSALSNALIGSRETSMAERSDAALACTSSRCCGQLLAPETNEAAGFRSGAIVVVRGKGPKSTKACLKFASPANMLKACRGLPKRPGLLL